MGNVYSNWTQIFPGRPTYNASDVPDQSRKVVIVTGGSSGIGKETCKVLLERNAKVYIATRNADSAKLAIDEVKEETGKEAIFLHMDLSDILSIRKAAETFKSKEAKLDILFNNGGVKYPPTNLLTVDGYDLQFGTNALGHYFFTILLLPTLIATAKGSPDGHARVINTSTVGHFFAGGIDWKSLKAGPERDKLTTEALYYQSKLATVLFTKELVRRYGDQGIVSLSLHPGTVRTNLLRHKPSMKPIGKLIAYPTPWGALTQLYAGTSPDAVKLNGEYLIPWARHWNSSAASNDPKLASELWDWFEEQVKGH